MTFFKNMFSYSELNSTAKEVISISTIICPFIGLAIYYSNKDKPGMSGFMKLLKKYSTAWLIALTVLLYQFYGGAWLYHRYDNSKDDLNVCYAEYQNTQHKYDAVKGKYIQVNSENQFLNDRVKQKQKQIEVVTHLVNSMQALKQLNQLLAEDTNACNGDAATLQVLMQKHYDQYQSCINNVEQALYVGQISCYTPSQNQKAEEAFHQIGQYASLVNTLCQASALPEEEFEEVGKAAAPKIANLGQEMAANADYQFCFANQMNDICADTNIDIINNTHIPTDMFCMQ